MLSARARRLAAALFALLATAPLAAADNHKWEIAEVFSSADGTVQFIELSNTSKDEHLLAGQRITTASGSVLTFPGNLPSSNTENRRVLIATAAFAAVPGAPTPDYLIPAGFLRTTGDTLTYVSAPDALAFGSLPGDGRTSLSGSGAQATNSPELRRGDGLGAPGHGRAAQRDGRQPRVLLGSAARDRQALDGLGRHDPARGCAAGGAPLLRARHLRAGRGRRPDPL